MKKFTAILLLLIFSNFAVAGTFDSGGGSSSSSEETDLTMIILAVVVVGVGALFISDILADQGNDSQDALTDSNTEVINEETGINWDQLNENADLVELPLVATSVFPGANGRDLATYFSNLIGQGNELYFDVYSAPVSFGQMSPEEAAITGFSFLNCQWYLSPAPEGLELYVKDSENPAWVFSTTEWDSTVVREASASFLEFAKIVQ